MATGSPIYWDACVFIAWLMNEPQPPGTMEAIEELVRLNDKGDVVIMSSVITRIEVLACKLTDSQRAKFERVTKRRSLELIACDHRIADMAHDIRSHYSSKGVSLLVPDCIHLATAIHYKAGEMHTFDGKDGEPDKLLALDGFVARWPLTIKMPWTAQPGLPYAPRR